MISKASRRLKDNKDIKVEIAGWVGMLMILVSYILLNLEVLKVSDPIYQLLNLVGSIGLLWISFVERAYQPAFLNFVWMVVALVGLISALV